MYVILISHLNEYISQFPKKNTQCDTVQKHSGQWCISGKRQEAVTELHSRLNTSSETMYRVKKQSKHFPVAMAPWHTHFCVRFWSHFLRGDSLRRMEVPAEKQRRLAPFPGARPLRLRRHGHALPSKAGNQNDSSKSVFVQLLRKYPVCRLVGFQETAARPHSEHSTVAVRDSLECLR